MKPLVALLPDKFGINFVSKRFIAIGFSVLLALASVGSLAVNKLNFGIDFAGGILLEVRTPQVADLPAMRAKVGALGLGDVSMTNFGDTGRDVMIRIQRQEGEQEGEAMAVLSQIKSALGEDIEYRRTELVGPKVGGELIRDGALALGLAIGAICLYIWFRFEWQFALGATVALMHDVFLTIGLFSLLGLEFNLTTIAALLTIAGYSINDTVIIYDRVRENLRRYKSLPLDELLNLSVNNVLSRTILTSVTTALAVAALVVFGGDVLRGFSVALMWGVFIGTYSTIYIALPFLMFFDLRAEVFEVAPDPGQQPSDRDEDPNFGAKV